MLARFRPTTLRAMVSWPRQSQAHDRRAVLAALEMHAADHAVDAGAQLGEIDLGLAVEHQPQRIGAAENGGRRRHGEGELEAHGVARLMPFGGDSGGRIGRRRM
ncbi:MAG: hypothetical protein P8Y53_25825 [Pseudolabrys sp.]